MTSANLTRSILNCAAGVRSYANVTIKGSIQLGGSNLNGLPFPLQAKFAHTLFTADVIHEGDRVTDVDSNVYDVHVVQEIWWLDQFFGYQTELFELQSGTLKALSYPALTYATSTIYINLAAQGLPQPFMVASSLTRSKYAAVTSAIVKEGDIIEDNNSIKYLVSAVANYPSKRTDGFQWSACSLTPIETATLKTLTLGATAETTTGHYPQNYANSTVNIVFAPKSQNLIVTSLGSYGRYDAEAVTVSTVYEGDIITYATVDYEVKRVIAYPTQRSDGFAFKVCGLVKRDFDAAPAWSGTWHLDSESVKTDPRNRIKTLIDSYLITANIKKDNGSTNASTLTCFDGATYPITRLFLTKALDAVAVISRKPSTVLYTDKLLGHKPYGFEEKVEIKIYTVNKATITGTNLAEKFEQEIRRIFTTYDAYANVRDIESVTPETTDLGYGYLYHTGIEINYKRSNDDYTATYPTITYGNSQASTYTFPNATSIKFTDADTGDVRLDAAERIGNITQIMGMEDFNITITADLDIEATTKAWKRPQATPSSPTDTYNDQVFREIKFSGKTSANQVYQNLNIGKGTTIPVRLTECTAEGSTLTVTFTRYSATAGNSGTYKAWYGISQ